MWTGCIGFMVKKCQTSAVTLVAATGPHDPLDKIVSNFSVKSEGPFKSMLGCADCEGRQFEYAILAYGNRI